MKKTRNDLPIKDPEFNIPQGYFDSLDERLLARIARIEATQPQKSATIRPIRRTASVRVWHIAAALAVLMAGIGLAFHLDRSAEHAARFAANELNAQQYLAALGYTLDLQTSDAQTQENPSIVTYLLDQADADDPVICLEQNDNIYALNCSEVEQYIVDNYNIIELATL